MNIAAATRPTIASAGQRTLRRCGKSAVMRLCHALLLAGLAVQPNAGWTKAPSSVSVSPSRQLQGLDVNEANTLLAKLEDAQRALKTGKFQRFELLAGSIASYPATEISPRAAFLQVQFAKVWQVTRGSSDNPLWQSFRLAYAPNGLGKLYWEIDVMLGSDGSIERVLMIYKPPAPL